MVGTDKALVQFLDGRNKGLENLKRINQAQLCTGTALNTNPAELFPSIKNLIT